MSEKYDVLIIEDDPAYAKKFASALGAYSPYKASTRDDAQKAILTYQPKFIVMDLMLPITRSGNTSDPVFCAEYLCDYILGVDNYSPAIVFVTSQSDLKDKMRSFIYDQLDYGLAEDIVLKLEQADLTCQLVKRRIETIVGRLRGDPSDAAARFMLHDIGLPHECIGLYQPVKSLIKLANSSTNVLIVSTDRELYRCLPRVIDHASVNAHRSEEFLLPAQYDECCHIIERSRTPIEDCVHIVLHDVDALSLDQQKRLAVSLKQFLPKSSRVVASVSTDDGLCRDLYYLLNQGMVCIERLVTRRCDVGPIALRLLAGMRNEKPQIDRPGSGITEKAIFVLQNGYDWPGDEPELKSVIASALASANGADIDESHLKFPSSVVQDSPPRKKAGRKCDVERKQKRAEILHDWDKASKAGTLKEMFAEELVQKPEWKHLDKEEVITMINTAQSDISRPKLKAANSSKKSADK